jgi:hypothetical protein
MAAALLCHTERSKMAPDQEFYYTRWTLAKTRFATAAAFRCCSLPMRCARGSPTFSLSGARAAVDRKSSYVRKTLLTSQRTTGHAGRFSLPLRSANLEF